MTKDQAKMKLQSRVIAAIREWNLDIFGDVLNQKEKLECDDPRDAIAFYLVKKHGWTLDYCRRLNHEDLEVLLGAEMKEWKMPTEIFEIHDELDNFLGVQ